MQIDIPFYKQSTLMNCGPMALKMILSYFGNDLDIEEIEKKANAKEGKGFSTLNLCIATVKLGFKAELFTKLLGFDKTNLQFDFYKQYGDPDFESQELVEEAKKLGVELHEKTIELEQVLSYLSPTSIPLILLDWAVVVGAEGKGFHGHFVPIVGYDEENVYVHDHGFREPKAHRAIKRDVFDKARKAKGTDEDLLIVYKA
jgi:hypothetical protein